MDEIDLNSTLIQSVRKCRLHTTCLLDLPDEILLMICRYLSPVHVLYSFYTPDMASVRCHRLISDYYTKIKLGASALYEYVYLANLLLGSANPLRPESLTLSNEHVSCVTQRFGSYEKTDTMHAIFRHLRRLILINCYPYDVETISYHYSMDLKQLEYCQITVDKTSQDANFTYPSTYEHSINRLLFTGQVCALHTIINDFSNGLVLKKAMKPHQMLRHIDIVLQTIDDLYILLDGLVPNVEKMIIQLHKSRVLTCHRPQRTSICSRLTEFTLLEPRVKLVIDDLDAILGYMPKLIRLTLSIRDTPDPTFCHGVALEAILTTHLPDLRQFYYTMTHRLGERTLVEDFVRWPMSVVYYESENCQWIHVYSSPWPANKEDRRHLPIANNGSSICVLSNVQQDEYMEHVEIVKHDDLIELKTRFRRAYQLTTCLSIDIKLPKRISKVILTEQIPLSSPNCVVQSSVLHLIVQRRLTDEQDISILAHQFPNVKYLQLLFPLDQSLFFHCFKTLFSEHDSALKETRFWSYLVNFCTAFVYEQICNIINDNQLHRWLEENTDLKYRKSVFRVHCSDKTFSIWL